MVHAHSRFEYRALLREAMGSLMNDNELALVRRFDNNAHMYCYSQIPRVFVGIGVSNNVNEYFHCEIKN